MSKRGKIIKESLFTNPLDILMLHLSDEIETRSPGNYYQVNDMSKCVEQLMQHQDEMFMRKIFYEKK
uniref:Uncharacterized protein n=1 Tax=Borely moumouvirus TaxID=2712067 RepID=A0A6G6ACW9_9VIRU